MGELRVEHQVKPVDCLVRDCSDIGTLIEVDDTGGTPETIRLVAPHAAVDRSCTVVRQTKGLLGVRFSD